MSAPLQGNLPSPIQTSEFLGRPGRADVETGLQDVENVTQDCIHVFRSSA